MEALIVTIVTQQPELASPPEPSPETPPAETAVEPLSATAVQSAQPPIRYDVAPRLAPLPDAVEVLAAPNGDEVAVALPPSVQLALARASDCAMRSDRGEPRPACPPIPEQLAFAGPGSDAFFDLTVGRERGLAAAWTTVSTYVSNHVVDDSIFEGRAGDPQAPMTDFEFYGRANRLLVDPRIFNAQTGELTITRQPGEP